MNYPNSFFEFIKYHINDDVQTLRLKKWKIEDFDTSFAINQIEIRKKIKSKLPTWVKNPKLIFPGILGFEQSSSELTAKYKQMFICQNDIVCDLTGGLGIDSYYFSLKAKHVTYIEQNENYCSVAAYNFRTLSADNVLVIHNDCRDFLNETQTQYDIIYIDPARRGKENKRLYALQDCEPDILKMMPVLCAKGKKIIIKVSPMVDITQVLHSLKGSVETHVLSVRNECKELLFCIDNTKNSSNIINCADIYNDEEIIHYSFSPEGERALPTPTYSPKIKKYLYEPNSSIMKAGAYKSVSSEYDIMKLHPSSHLYTSDNYVCNFPGRKFKVIKTLKFSGQNSKALSQEYPKANISTRNFPIGPEEVKKKLKIKDGGGIYIFATTTGSCNDKILIICEKAQ